MARAGWWWIDRWRKSTAYTDMTLEEQGAYRNLLDELWLRGGVLPNDDRILAKICGDAMVWTRLRDVVLKRFVLTAEGWRNPTHDEVAAGSGKFQKAQALKGKKGALKRWGSNGPANSPAINKDAGPASGPADGRTHGLPSPSPSPIPNNENSNGSPPAVADGPPTSTALVVTALKAWSTEACKDWAEFLGQPPGQVIGRALRPVVDRHGWDAIRPLWRKALEDAVGWGEPGKFTAWVFVRTVDVELRRARGETRSPPGKKVEAIAESSRLFLESVEEKRGS